MNSPPSGAIAVLNMNTVYHVSTYSQVIGSHLADIQRCQVRVPGVPRKRARTWRARLLGRLRGSDATDDVLRAVEVVDRAVAAMLTVFRSVSAAPGEENGPLTIASRMPSGHRSSST